MEKSKQDRETELKEIQKASGRLREVEFRWPTSQCNDFPSLTTNPQFSFGEVIKSLASLTAHIKDIWRLEITRIFSADSQHVSGVFEYQLLFLWMNFTGTILHQGISLK
ncbi:tripartite motif-containing 16-like protein [Labeo rohita]|uniref:Tripartite motif-containing 16-like protein n=1 Tax=Labeo rohita TaxID=84645 RepID=A0A498LJ68_LABRO|nr:tripartite motif-containing 16-like protein [Labeo rohita]